MTENKKTPQDVLDQGELYPTNIKIEVPIQSSKVGAPNILLVSDNAIQIEVKIESPVYQKKDVTDAISRAYLKLLECFR